MLPQVANHIFHHTTRAVAAAPAVHKVLGTAPPTPSWTGAGSSYGAGAGTGGHAGAGGSKYHAGSRFYSGYTGPGRAVTQANTSTANATELEEEEVRSVAVPTARRKFRARSQSFSLGSGAHGKSARAQSLGVLKAVQAQIRHRHAFIAPTRPLLPAAEEIERPATPRLVRRNSTASTLSVPPSPTLPPETRSRPPSPLQLSPTHPSSPQTVQPPFSETETARLLKAAKGDPHEVRVAIERLRSPETLSVASEWNLAIRELATVRVPKDPVQEIVAIYHDMLARNFRPEMDTYACLLDVLLQRAIAVNISIRSIKESVARRALLPQRTSQISQHDFMDRQSLAALEAEENYASAITLFRTVDRVSGWKFNLATYDALLQACAEHRDVEAALQVYAHMERRHVVPRPQHFASLMRTYADTGDFEGARVVFAEMKRVTAEGVLGFNPKNVPLSRRRFVAAYNEMIRVHILAGNGSAALMLLEQMMDSAPDFDSRAIPCPAASTYDTIIEAFTEAGDLASAMSWYDRLVAQGTAAKGVRGDPTLGLPKPTPALAEKIVVALAQAGRVDEMNAFAAHAAPTWHSTIVFYLANIRALSEAEPGKHVVDALNRLHASAFPSPQAMLAAARDFRAHSEPFAPAVALFARSGRLDLAADLLVTLYSFNWDTREFWTLHESALNALLYDRAGAPADVPLASLLKLARAPPAVAFGLPEPAIEAIFRAFEREAADGPQVLALPKADWDFVQYTATSVVTGSREGALVAQMVLKAMARAEVPTSAYTSTLVKVLADSMGATETSELLASLGPAYEALQESSPAASATATPELSSGESVFSSQDRPSTADTSVSTADRIDGGLTKSLKQRMYQMSVTSRDALEEVWAIFAARARQGVFPAAPEIGDIIQFMGRCKDMGRMYDAYDTAQRALATIADDKPRMRAWGTIENAMIIGLAHAGDGHRADAHRTRMLEQGLSPNADAYAALIQAVRDTTDDTSVAMTYFDEAVARGVEPNLFLFNTAISKLAKARKAELALALFKRMTTLGLRRTPVTYGAVIGACCRVGDVASAETLFEEMLATQKDKKLRVPPFNTMMQFFVQTKPNRERVLDYYSRLTNAGILPSAHTYKLVLDAYGSIEPVDFPAMERTFATLCADPRVQVEPVHWASLINAYGCVGKDLAKAIATFDSIAIHPSSGSGHAAASAVVYEALINVFVSHRRVDLVPPYLERLRASGVHMTAYIVNLLIRGYALTGDITTARNVFEAMVDPPAGVAAPNNHAPHDASAVAPDVSPDAPVYREPSTWEAMVRAELGQGNRNQALELLERLAMRHYPESIYKRISGIMLDDSVSPWPEASAVDVAALGT